MEKIEKMYLSAADIAQALGVSRSKSYGVITKLNKELESKGMIIVRGKVNRKYFYERYGWN